MLNKVADPLAKQFQRTLFKPQDPIKIERDDRGGTAAKEAKEEKQKKYEKFKRDLKISMDVAKKIKEDKQEKQR